MLVSTVVTTTGMGTKTMTMKNGHTVLAASEVVRR
jgi:hypothetical protein